MDGKWASLTCGSHAPAIGWRTVGTGGAGLPADVDGLFDLGVLDLELEGARQRRRQIERQPRGQQD